jgi:CdiI N-terminal domain
MGHTPAVSRVNRCSRVGRRRDRRNCPLVLLAYEEVGGPGGSSTIPAISHDPLKSTARSPAGWRHADNVGPLARGGIFVFRIRFFTPSVPSAGGHPQAGAELQLGNDRLRFVVELEHWPKGAYEAQWRAGIGRLAHGAPSTALVTAYRGPDAEMHLMWALWRDDDYVYAQEVSVLASELEAPFDPANPYEHVGERVPMADQGLPIAEYRCDLTQLLAAYFLPTFRWH